MTELIPNRFLFRFSIPVKFHKQLPGLLETGETLPESCTLPDPQELDQQQPFGMLRVGWNTAGLGLSLRVRGKRSPVKCRPNLPDESDSLHVWIDTRNTQNIHRASRYCHHFVAFPAGEGKANSPSARQLAIARAREEAPLCNPQHLAVTSTLAPDGYLLNLWLPARTLHGFDPESNPRLGFYYWIKDDELGEQFLSVGHEFPFAQDPSLWWTLELQS